MSKNPGLHQDKYDSAESNIFMGEWNPFASGGMAWHGMAWRERVFLWFSFSFLACFMGLGWKSGSFGWKSGTNVS